MSGLRETELSFEVAGPKDEDGLRKFSRRQSLPGWVSLRFEREPNYFHAVSVQGDRHHALVARDAANARISAMHTRVVRRVYIDGIVQRLGYLGQLRTDDSLPKGFWRYRRLMREGFEAGRRLCRAADELPYDLTSILADNRPARRFLEAGLRGLPRYTPVANWHTLVFSSRTRPGRSSAVRRASHADVPAIARLLNDCNARMQFAPVWTEADLLCARRSRGLSPTDFVVAESDGRLSACVAVWDQRAFKQTIVDDYRPAVRYTRPAINLLAPLLRLPKLPAIGATLRDGWLSHFAMRDSNAELAHELLRAAFQLARSKGLEQVMLGLSDTCVERLALRRKLKPWVYGSILYSVHWPDETVELPDVSRRDIYVETATL